MKRSRLAILLLGIGALVLVGLLFPQFIMANIVAPMATVIWLLLRLFVLSIDQVYYWWLLILLAGLFAIIRLSQGQRTVVSYEPPETNPTLDNIDHWRLFFQPGSLSDGDNGSARRELVWLLTSIYASRQQGTINYQVREALEDGEIPLPPQVHAFLFPPQPEEVNRTFFQDPLGVIQRRILAIVLAPRRWVRRWSGQEAADFYHKVDLALTMMETSLEIRHDDDPNTPNQY